MQSKNTNLSQKPAKKLKSVEIKTMQRHSSCDISGMLFYTYYLIKYQSEKDKDTLYSNIYLDFISKCLLCGCNKAQSGKEISCYIIQKACLADFFYRIKDDYSKKNADEKDTEKRWYKDINAVVEQMMIDTLSALAGGLKKCKYKNEQVLIYDETENKTIPFLDDVKDQENARKFLTPLFNLNDEERKKQRNQSDAVSALYNKLKTDYAKQNKIPLIYYTLRKNDHPAVLNKKYFIFCKESDRSEEGCVTRSIAKKIQDALLNKKTSVNKTKKDDEKDDIEYFEDFFKFAGLKIRYVKEKPDTWNKFKNKNR
jgi:hypothetical protein